jgi:hypothetical protein
MSCLSHCCPLQEEFAFAQHTRKPSVRNTWLQQVKHRMLRVVKVCTVYVVFPLLCSACVQCDRLCCLVVRVPGSIPGVTRVVGLQRVSLSLVSTIEELLERKNSSSDLENRDYGLRDPPRLPRDTPLSAKVGTNFADSGRCSSLAD